MSAVRTGQAGTVESMDCLVTISESGDARVIEIAGSGAVRFKGAIEATINSVLDDLNNPGIPSPKVTVQDNGALDVVLRARVEAAYRRYAGGAL